MEELIQILVQFGGGKGGEPNNVAVRFLLPTFFWCILALTSFREWRTTKVKKDLYIGIASLMGMSRELLMFIAEYGGMRGFVPFHFLYSYYPPLEHAVTMLSNTFIGYAFLNYHLKWEKFPRMFLITAATITVLLYIIIGSVWPEFLTIHPGASFGMFWGDLAFRVFAAIFIGVVLGALVHAAGDGKNISKALLCGFCFLFLDEFLMIFNILSNERLVDIYAPIRHNLHIWAIPLFLGMYWNELQHRMSEAKLALKDINDELEQRIALRTSQLTNANHELEQAYSDLKSAQSHMLQQEKMASIGQLAAGVAHEINNPVGFVMSNLSSLRKYTEKLLAFIQIQNEVLSDSADVTTEKQRAFQEYLTAKKKSLKIDYISTDALNLIDESLEGANRVKIIVQNLKNFSRIDAAESKPVNLNDAIECTLQIVWNEIKYKATVTREFGDIPITVCNLGELNQVFTNLLINATHAIKNMGKITIRTWSEENDIYLAFSDTGCGIPVEIRQRIFEPFFTTKDVGKGTGLGLSICYDIIKKHNGDIEVTSEVDKGTTFTVRLPINLG